MPLPNLFSSRLPYHIQRISLSFQIFPFLNSLLVHDFSTNSMKKRPSSTSISITRSPTNSRGRKPTSSSIAKSPTNSISKKPSSSTASPTSNSSNIDDLVSEKVFRALIYHSPDENEFDSLMREINVKADHKIVEKTIRSFTNNWKIAYNFFNWADTQSGYEHSTGVCNLMLDILGKALEFDLCEKLIEKLREKSGLADQTTFRIMFKRYASAHMVKEAIEIYQKMEDFKLKDKTAFFTLIDALCEHKHVTEAEELALGKDREFPIETKTYNIVIRGWCKLGWWQKCRSFWEEMDQKGIARDLYSYTIYMGILIKMNKPWKAVKLYDEMKEKGIVFDTAAYNTVIHALGLANEVRKSLQVYYEMVDMGCPPNIVTYNTIIKLLCRTGRITEAYDLLEQMPSNGYAPNAITYHCFFSSLSEPKALLDLFDRMVESGCSPIMETYVMLIKKFGSLGYLRPVFHVWKVMEERGCSPDEFAYNALIDALIQKGRLDLARKYDEEMLARGVSLRPRKELQMKSLGGNSDYEIDDF